MSDDLDDNGGSRWKMTAGNNVGDDVGNDVGDRDDGVNNAGNNASKGDGGDPSGEGGGAPGGGQGGGSGGGGNGGDGGNGGGGCILQGLFAFYCEDFLCGIFMGGGNWRGHTSSHTLVALEVCRLTFGCGR